MPIETNRKNEWKGWKWWSYSSKSNSKGQPLVTCDFCGGAEQYKAASKCRDHIIGCSKSSPEAVITCQAEKEERRESRQQLVGRSADCPSDHMILPSIAARPICYMSTSPVVQYIVVRGDLGWPVGALIGKVIKSSCQFKSDQLVVTAQGAHASVAAISRSMDQPMTQSYLSQLERMYKIVLKSENEDQMRQLVLQLTDAGIQHHAWIEQPEDLMASVATAPNVKSLLQPFFKQFKLFK